MERHVHEPTSSATFTKITGLTRRGFTGHQQADELELIHMNGRTYDTRLGRFMQADIVVQSPFDTQSYNRYSYLTNNPLNGTDPSGYFGVKDLVGVGVAVAGTWICGPQCGWQGYAMIGAASGGAQSAANGGNFNQIVQGAAWGAFSSAAFYGVGQAFSQGGTVAFSSASSGYQFAWATTQGAVGGGISVLQGGNFRAGFAGSFVTKYADVNSLIGPGDNLIVARVFTAAIIGGTISEISGGKFANGAISGALMQAVNGENECDEQCQINRDFGTESPQARANQTAADAGEKAAALGSDVATEVVVYKGIGWLARAGYWFRGLSAARGVASLPTKPGQLGHIFRNAPGHLADTPANRQLLTDVASNSANRLGADRFGNVWSSVTRADGTQVWVSTRNGVIQNGGLNQVPQAFPTIVGP
ncbi:MAG: hypothetical protein IPJ33_04570 [Gammaproteobacteria bacterium]|nr:hypothetical protein [Gammaproteobacteria bacterium]